MRQLFCNKTLPRLIQHQGRCLTQAHNQDLSQALRRNLSRLGLRKVAALTLVLGASNG